MLLWWTKCFLTIHVSKTVYVVTSSVENVTLKVKEVADYNFKDLFVVSIDGEKLIFLMKW